MRKVLIIPAILLSFLIGIFLQWKFNLLNRLVPIKISKIETGINKVEKPISTLTIVDLGTCKLYVIVNSDSIWFEPFENALCGSKPGLTIEKDQYPNLFKQGIANSSLISIEKEKNIDSTVIVSNEQPDHGAYSPAYQLTVNIKTGEIREKEVKDLFEDYNKVIKGL